MSAIISPCGLYRTRLERICPGHLSTGIIMVNPSKADARRNDTTISKLMGFGERHRWGKLIVGNLFGYRATDVRELGKVTDPVGPDTDQHLRDIFAETARVIVAWGPISKQPKYHRGRWREVVRLIDGYKVPMFSIGEPAKCGHPKHPLMLPYDSEILPWTPPA